MKPGEFMDINSMSGAYGSPPGGIKAPARKAFADPEIADKILDAPWIRGDNSWLGHVGSKDIIVWAIENKKMIEGGRGEPINPVSFCVRINHKIEGKDPVVWALAKQLKIDGDDPIAWAVKNNKQINEQNPVTWAAKNKQMIEGQDPIIWADIGLLKIIEQDSITHLMKEVDAITWAVENKHPIDNRNAIAWAIDNNKPIASKDPVVWCKEHAAQSGKDALAFMIEIGVSKVEKMQDLIHEAVHQPNSEQLHNIGLAIIQAKPDVEAVIPALAHLYIKKKSFLPKPNNLVRLNDFMNEIDKNVAGVHD